MFQLTREEILRISQTVISSESRTQDTLKFSKNVFVFTEQGVVMAATVLKSNRAIDASIMVVDAFVAMREMFFNYKKLAFALAELKKTVGSNKKDVKLAFVWINRILETMEMEKKKKAIENKTKKARVIKGFGDRKK